jgi:hypothetical protein
VFIDGQEEEENSWIIQYDERFTRRLLPMFWRKIGETWRAELPSWNKSLILLALPRGLEPLFSP